jgi:sugar phosphate isomerase/epimerase
MKIAFTTLGCPTWDMDTICQRASDYGFDGIDFRGYLDALDVTKLPAFNRDAAKTLRKIKAGGLRVSGIGSSITVCAPERLKENLDEARRTITTAHALDAGNVRIFGGGDLQTHSRSELAKIGCETIEKILTLDGAADLHWLFETHDLWIQSTDCSLLLDAIPNPAFGALWDMGHTPRVGGESPAQTIAALNMRIGYTHIKDAIYSPQHPLAMEDGWYYVSPGMGQVPLAEAIRLLGRNGYDGWLVFEHEKRWHPNLAEPEEVFPPYARWARSLAFLYQPGR